MRCAKTVLAILAVSIATSTAAASEPEVTALDPETGEVMELAQAPVEPAPTLAEGDPEAGGEPAPAGLFAELSPEETAQYAAALREVVALVRGRVLDKISGKIEAKQVRRMDLIAGVLFIFSLAGFLMLLAPLYLRKRHPGRGGVLLKYGALGGVMFFVAVNLFAGVLMIMRGAQAKTGKITNPQIRMVDATFDLFAEKAEDLSMVGPTVVEPTLLSLTGDTDQPVLTTMLDNVQKLQQDVSVFATVGRFFTRLDFLFGLLPIFLVGLAALLFAKATRPTLVEIVKLPSRAAAGEQGVAGEVARATLRSVWHELKATLCVIVVLLTVMFLAGIILGYVLVPAVEIFIAYLVVSLVYLQVADQASSFWIIFSLMGSIVFLLLNLVVVLVSSALFLAKAQKIFQRRFREGIPLRSHARFWKWGTAGLLWSQLLPLLYVTASVPAIGWLVERSVDEGSWELVLGLGPALFVITFMLAFWLAQGFRALAFLKKYDPVAPAGATWQELAPVGTGPGLLPPPPPLPPQAFAPTVMDSGVAQPPPPVPPPSFEQRS